MDRVCFFHAGCPDGFGAAWAVWRAWGDEAIYVPRGHDDSLDARAHRDRQVVFVDIAPPNAALSDLLDSCRELIVLDHHISSRSRYEAEPTLVDRVRAGGHRVHFDLEHSGAVLAWLHFHPDEPVPELLRYVEDQDLWNWKLPSSAEVNATIGSHPRTFADWNELCATPVERLVDEGAALVRAHRIEIERSLESAHTIRVGPQPMEAVNALQQRSQIGHELASRARFGVPCGAVYRIQGRRVDCSLYSTGDFDVADIASGYGGGGHRNAAGFSVTLATWLRDFCADGDGTR